MKRFIFISFFLVFFSIALESKDFYLLSVGIADYPGTRNDLNLPANDAKAIASLYKTCNKAHTVLLINENATKENIIVEAKSLFQKAGKQDVIIFFFSGHGSTGCFCAYDGNLKYSELRSIFASCKATSKIIFADACLSGGMRQGGHTGRHNFGSDVMLFLSSRDDEYSMERKDMKNGFFTACLVRCLKGGADGNKDKIITAKELYIGVSKGVIKLSNDKQHPVMWGNFDDNMPIINWN